MALPASQAPLVSDDAYVSGEVSAVNYEWKVGAARMALQSGLSVVAADIYESLYNELEFVGPDRAKVSLDYVAALIAQSQYGKAAAVLKSVPATQEASRRSLYAASIGYGQNSPPNSDAISIELSRVDPDDLSAIDVPWYYLLQGILASLASDSNKAEDLFEMAERSAASSMQSALFSSLILRQKILNSPTDENLLVAIREKFEALAGQSAAFPFLREYVIILHGIGRGAEAIRLLEVELANVSAGYSMDERASLLLLKGLILGLDSSAGWSSLKELLRAGVDSEATVIALQLLGAAKGRESELMVLLNEIISRPEPHPLIAQLYYMRCQLALANPQTTALAEADARYLLEQFPGLSEISSVYRLLAYAALQRNPPRYRVAADYLLDIRDQSSLPSEVAQLNRLIGDCYFLNRDYANAVDFYDSANTARGENSGRDDVLLRLVISQVRSGKFDAALANIDHADFAGQIGHAERWRAEWSIALALQANGQSERALERLRLLIGKDMSSVPAALDLRLRWLEAHISLQLGQDSGISENLESLLVRIDSMPGDALGSEESARLRSELMLLQSKSLIAQGDERAAFEVIATIREEFRDNIAAQRSYFTEAAYHASTSDFSSAKQALIFFAQDYQDSPLVPQALFEAALHCQRQGPDNYGEAVVLLDRLVKDYPESELAYFTGLKQGDLLRLMNDFAGAQLIYENLINSFPTHRLRYAAELSLADCIAALAQGEEDQLAEATAILERLVDRPDVPVEVQIEAGYKWCSILVKNSDLGAAKTVHGLVTSRYLLDPQNATGLTSVGRYWLSRTIFSLCDILEGEGDVTEAGKLYRKLVAFNLPGRSLALSRISQLQLAESP